MSEIEIIWAWAGCLIMSTGLGVSKERVLEGFCVSLLFGPLGLIYMIGAPYGKSRCQWCKAWLFKKSQACPHCTREQ